MIRTSRAALFTALTASLITIAAPATAQQVTKQTVPGITNFAKLENTIACGGATGPEAMAELRKLGFKSVINLRQETEANANIPAAAAAAKAAQLNYIHIPFSGQAPDPAAADKFLEEITKPANQPVYVHCAAGSRAAAMWMIKRLVVDKWDEEKAATEATALGMASPALRKFAVEYAASRRGAAN